MSIIEALLNLVKDFLPKKPQPEIIESVGYILFVRKLNVVAFGFRFIASNRDGKVPYSVISTRIESFCLQPKNDDLVTVRPFIEHKRTTHIPLLILPNQSKEIKIIGRTQVPDKSIPISAQSKIIIKTDAKCSFIEHFNCPATGEVMEACKNSPTRSRRTGPN